MTRYIALIDGKRGAYGVAFPDCPGCTAMGKSLDEALANARAALFEWIDDAAADDNIPEARTVEAAREDSEVAKAIRKGAALAVVPLIRESGRPKRANLSLDAGLLDAIDEAAAAAGLTRSAFLASAAREKILAG
ncbi:MAG: HicB family protein [Hyphomicrobiales bacterium]|nr:HicB family protein [Hyphomicrobiales bacterium]